MNNNGASNILVIFLLLAFLAASGLAFHYKVQRDKYYNQINGVQDAGFQFSL